MLQQSISLNVSFTLKLGRRISTHAVALGCFDGQSPCLAVVDTSGKVFLHNVDVTSAEGAQKAAATWTPAFRLNGTASTVLNINQQVKMLAAGKLSASDDCDRLIIGTASHVIVYDVLNNSDIFYKKVVDGLSCIAVGRFLGDEDDESTPVVICGGCCSLQGFNLHGKETFWTVAGDNVRAMCFADFDLDGKPELLVGSDDYDIRVFKGEDIIAEINETEAITELHPLGGNRFAYGLANGTLGVYAGSARLWRIKSKSSPTCLCLYDIDGDGEEELVAGWSSGKIDFRKANTGQPVGKDHVNSALVGLLLLRLPNSERVHLIACSAAGEVRGYSAVQGRGCVIRENALQEMIRDLSIEKQNLLADLENYKYQADQPPKPGQHDSDSKGVPLDTVVSGQLEVVVEAEAYIKLHLCTNNDTIIRGVVVFAERIFAGESHATMVPKDQCSNKVSIKIRPTRDVPADLHVKALVGYKKNPMYQVFSLVKTLPRFSMYALCNDSAPCPDCGLAFSLREPVQRMATWVEENFLLDGDFQTTSGDQFVLRLANLRSGCLAFVLVANDGRGQVRCDDVDTCGAILQSFGHMVDSDRRVSAYFPQLTEKYQSMAQQVRDLSMMQEKITAEISEHINLAKCTQLRAEDARILEDYDSMKLYYKQLMSIDETLLSTHDVRLANNVQLSETLKQMNQIIQSVSNLRVLSQKNAFLRACRSVISSGEVDQVLRILDLDAHPLENLM